MDKRIAEVWSTFYRTKSRGEEEIPIVVVRYIKGQMGDESKKRKQIRDFLKSARKKLNLLPVTVGRLKKWLEENGESFLGNIQQISSKDYSMIAKIMNREEMTMDILDYIFENEDIQIRYNDFLNNEKLDELDSLNHLLYRIYSALQISDEDILPLLDPKLFMKKGDKEEIE